MTVPKAQRLDVHHFFHFAAGGADPRIDQLLTQGVQLMAKFDDVDADLDSLKQNVAELAREVKVLVDRGPGVITQEQLDLLDAKVKAIADAAKAADPNP